MNSVIKAIVTKLIKLSSFTALRTKIGRGIIDILLDNVREQFVEVNHDGVSIKLSVANRICRFRADTFSTKEPETLAWIDDIEPDSVIWDVGANVGLYSVYAALRRRCKVFAFEPSVFNLELLARNIWLNGLQTSVCIVPIALSDATGSNLFRMTSTSWGGALSTFKQQFGWNGQALHQVFAYSVIGLSMDDALDALSIPQPDYIKIDVDGIEHIILSNGINVLERTKGLLVEVNDEFKQQATACNKVLESTGFRLKAKLHSDMFDDTGALSNTTYNQIWEKD